MRIITGDFKGRKIEMPAGYDIRPTTEKVKEAMFSIIGQDIYDAVCVDLFSGVSGERDRLRDHPGIGVGLKIIPHCAVPPLFDVVACEFGIRSSNLSQS